MDKPLLLALIGITSILVDLGPETKQYGDKCIDEAESLIFAELEKPSTVKVQALALIIKHRWASGRFSSAFMLLGIASRLAVVLRLNHEQPHLCFLAQESRRRLMWALYVMDSGAAGGYEDFAQWSAERVRLQLPCNERNFELDLPQTTEGLVPPPQPISEDLGNLALHVRVVWLRSKTVSFGRKAIRVSTHQELAALPSAVTALDQELNDFNQSLRASFKYTKNNLRLRMYSPRLCVFVMVHIWWRQCHMDLYRFAIQGIIEALPKEVMGRCDPAFLTLCRQQCVEHASAMSDIFRDMLELDTGIPVTDLDLPVCAYQSARMLHYAYRTSGNELGMSAEDVITRSERCLCIVKASCNGCPAVKNVQLDLERLIQHGPSLQ
ncbi:MAG: fungal specific transcription factor domain-containing protein, partial [Cytophagales bacterium]|nr:fungal specific transcription factor domain-containing protein [Cytophagales bacterium]